MPLLPTRRVGDKAFTLLQAARVLGSVLFPLSVLQQLHPWANAEICDGFFEAGSHANGIHIHADGSFEKRDGTAAWGLAVFVVCDGVVIASGCLAAPVSFLALAEAKKSNEHQ